MDLENLKAFIAVAETGSFSLAADKMHVTQPAISKRIAQLEYQLNAKLFDRIGRTVGLTEAGRTLNGRAVIILKDIEDTERQVRNLSGTVGGQLSLATSHHIGLWRLPNVLRQYSMAFPDVTLDLHFMDSEVAHDRIVQGELEMAIITLAPSSHDRLIGEPIWRDELVFVAAIGHPLNGKQGLNLATLCEYPAILPDMSTFTGRIVKNMFEDNGLRLRVARSTNYLETIKMLIGAGLGWSVLPKSMLDSDVCVLEIAHNPIERTLGVIYHVNRTLSNAGNAFIQSLRSNSDYRVT